MNRFNDRTHAGKLLADSLMSYRGQPNTVVLALPRGGVPVGFEISKRLQLPMDVFIVRKLGVPGYEEFAMGAVASGGTFFLDHKVVSSLNISDAKIEEVKRRETQEILRRNTAYRGAKPDLELLNKHIIIVDDGLATGATMKAAVAAIKQKNPRKITVALPVGAEDSINALKWEADEVVCLVRPKEFFAVGVWYEDFPQTSDEEVKRLLREAEAFSLGPSLQPSKHVHTTDAATATP